MKTKADPKRATVAVVITTFNDAAFLPDALASLEGQTCPADEIIVVDDGSDEEWAGTPDMQNVKLIRQGNQGLAAARNAGLSATQSDYVLFLDADDRLLECALQKGLETFKDYPESGMVYGAHRRVNNRFVPLEPDKFSPTGDDAVIALLQGNVIGMHATVLYRTAALRKIGGFDAGLRRCEDYDVYLRMAQQYPIRAYDETVAEYRQHGGNMSADREAMLKTVLLVHARYEPPASEPERRAAWLNGRAGWTNYYRRRGTHLQDGRKLLRKVKNRLLKAAGLRWPPAVGRVRLGHLGTPRPVSLDFGWDRGKPVDRHYVEAFLAKNSCYIRGRVLEIGDDSYSRQFGGGQVSHQDILHVEKGNPKATIVGDITKGAVVPNTFDCIVFTQTLHLIFDIKAAIQALHAALKPGGVLLLTVPGISQIDRGRWGETWFWSFTRASIERLFQPVFGTACDIAVDGNVFAATCYLQGLAIEEIDTAKLAVHDFAYPVIISLCAQKVSK